MNPFNFFDKIFCINLEQRTDRWEKCTEIFKDLKITDKVIKFKAIDYSQDESIVEIHRGRCGCAQSHIDILKYSKEQN